VAKTYRLGPSRRAVNVVMTAMLRHGIGGKSSVLLTTTGRKSGEESTTPVILVENGDGRWLVSPYGAVSWVYNVRASHQVTLRRGKVAELMLAHEVGPVDAGPILRQYVRSVRVTAPFFDAKAEDPVERFVEEAHRHPVFKLARNPQR
jgi:deazaflavin-dependent oxidoreductase (nitroreductase family)